MKLWCSCQAPTKPATHASLRPCSSQSRPGRPQITEPAQRPLPPPEPQQPQQPRRRSMQAAGRLLIQPAGAAPPSLPPAAAPPRAFAQQQRAAAAGAAAAAAPAADSSAAGSSFNDLPAELQRRITDLVPGRAHRATLRASCAAACAAVSAAARELAVDCGPSPSAAPALQRLVACCTQWRDLRCLRLRGLQAHHAPCLWVLLAVSSRCGNQHQCLPSAMLSSRPHACSGAPKASLARALYPLFIHFSAPQALPAAY